MSVVMIIATLPIGVVEAGMVSTKTIIEQQSPDTSVPEQTEVQREQIRTLLARDDVRAEMLALGIAPAEAEARIAALTDEEISDIAGRLDELPAGEGIGSILVIVFIVFGVAVLVDALGLLNLFPFVCGPGECVKPLQQAAYPGPAAGPAQADPYAYDQRQPAYRNDQYGQTYDGRFPSGYDSNQYYEPQPQPATRNYYEERFGAQRYVR